MLLAGSAPGPRGGLGCRFGSGRTLGYTAATRRRAPAGFPVTMAIFFSDRARVVLALCLWAHCVAGQPALGATAPRPVTRRLRLEVSIRGPLGWPVHRAMALTVVEPPAARHCPFLVILHGRPGSVDARVRMGLVEFPGNADYFARLGYVVLVPTRVGYGVTGGPDIEYTGPCFYKDYGRGMEMVVQELRQVMRYAAALPGVDPRRGLVVGDSFGGVAAVAAAAAGLPGLRGAVNFSGGDGGDLMHHIDHPCRADQMASTLAAYGRRDRVPTLWLYSANDRYWGAQAPRRWFDAFVGAGGRGRFIELPADKNNGHFIFNRNPQAWHGAFEAFAASLGLPS